MSRAIPMVLGILALVGISGSAFAGKKAAPLPATGRTLAGPVSVQIPDGDFVDTLASLSVPTCMTVVNTGKGIVSFSLLSLSEGQSGVVCRQGGTESSLGCTTSAKRGCTATWRVDRYLGH